MAEPSDLRLPQPTSVQRTTVLAVRHSAVMLLILSAAILLTAWSFVIPIFEGPDEYHHWQFARYLHEYRSLPVYNQNYAEGNSPPLYYMLIAPVATDTEIPPAAFTVTSQGWELAFPPRLFQNANDDLQRYWPLRLARLLTVAMSVATVILCFVAGREATGSPSGGLLCAGLVAFLPQFTFRGSHVSNDTLVTTLCAAALCSMVIIVRRGFTWRRGVVLALICAAAFLTKKNALFLLAPMAIAVFTPAAPWRTNVLRVAVTSAITVMLVAPWTLRNIVLYGDPLAERAMYQAVGQIIVEKSFFDPFFYTEFPRLLTTSFIATFGWMNVSVPGWVYLLWIGLGVVGLIFAAGEWFRGRLTTRLVLICLSFIVLSLIVVVRINLQFTQPQGRYLFPALPALALLTAAGLNAVARRIPALTPSLLVTLGVLNLYILLGIVQPLYWPAPRQPVADLSRDLPVAEFINLPPEAAQSPVRLTNEDPQIIIRTPLNTDEYAFLEVTMAGDAAGARLPGVVYIMPEEARATQPKALPFQWVADGQPQKVVIPLAAAPEWHGVVPSLRIDPVDGQAAADQIGMTISIEHVRVLSNLPRAQVYLEPAP